jgi:hypothetical protein
MASLFASRFVKDVGKPLIGLSVFGGIGYIFYENLTKKSNPLNNNKMKISKMVSHEEIIERNITPEEIFALQFNENKRNVYEKLVKYPGIIINCGLVPVSIGCMFVGSGGFGIGCCLMYLVLYSDIVNNNISKSLNKKNLIIDEKDFLTIHDIKLAHMSIYDNYYFCNNYD